MTETKEVRHAGIGLALNIDGLEAFRRLDKDIDKILGKFRDLKSMMGGTKGLFDGFSGAGQSINKASDAINEVHKITRDLKADTNQAGQGFKTMSSDIDSASKAAKDLQKSANIESSMKESKSAVNDVSRSVKDMNSVIDRAPSQRLTEVRDGIKDVKKSTDDTTDSVKKGNGEVKKSQDRIKNLHDSIASGFIGGAITNAFSWIGSELKSITQQGYELAEGGEQIRDQWKNIGLSDTQAHGMTDQIAEIRGQSNMAGSALDAIQKKFYAVTDSVPKAKKFTNEIAAFGTAAGKSSEQIQQISMGVAKLTGSKKVSAGFFQRSFGQVPALQKAIVKASGMTNKAFTSALQNGKVTGSQLQGYMSKAAKGSSKEWSEFSKTTRGRLAGIAGTFQNLKAVFAAPLVGGIAAALDTVDKKKGGLGDVKKQLQDIAKALGTKMGNYVGDAIKFLVKNRKALAEMAKAIFTITKNIGLGVWKGFSGTIAAITGHFGKASGGLKSTAGFLDDISKHQNAFQNLGKGLLAFFAIYKTVRVGMAVHTAGAAVSKAGEKLIGSKKVKGLIFQPTEGENETKELSKYMVKAKKITLDSWNVIRKNGSKTWQSISGASQKAWSVTRSASADGMDKLIEGFGKLKEKSIDVGQKMWKALRVTANVATAGAKKAISGISSLAVKTGGLMKRGLKFTAKVATKAAVGALELLKKAALGVGKGFKTMFTLMKTNPLIAIISAVVAVIAILTVLYKHNKKFRNFVNGLLKWGKKFATGIGKSFGQAYRSVTKWMRKLVSGVNKRWGNLWKDVKRVMKSAWNAIKDILRVFYDVFTGRFTDLKKVIPKLVKDLWKYVKSLFKGAYDFLDDLTGGWISRITKAFTNAWKDIGKGWKSFWNGLDDWFSDLWKSIVKHVQSGINDIIDTLNGGIKGIDFVISKFGGSSKAIGTINHVHLATGTGVFSSQRRAITRPTMAMLNDGHDSPETGNREMLIHSNGMPELIKGTNVMRMLEPGAEVLNASETRMMGMQHFANGSGLLSGIWDGAKHVGSSIANGVKSSIGTVAGVLKATKQTFDTVKNIIKSPSKYLSNMLTKPTGTGEIMSDFAKGMYSNVKKQAGSWWQSLWGMVNLDGGASGSGSRGAFLDEAIKIGKAAKGYSEGAGRLGPNYYDCSGLVYTALKHMGVNVSGGSTTQPEYRFTKSVSWGDAEPGDLAFYGAGGSQHVGIVSSTAGNGQMWNAENERDGIKYGPIKGFGDFAGLRRITQLSSKESTGKKKKQTTSGSLQKMIKSEVGGGFFKFMSKLASKFGSGGAMGSVSLSGDMASRARELAKALKKAYPSATSAGIAGILGNWMQESRLSASAVNSSDHGTGLGQWTNTRETGLRNWLKKHGYAWNSAAGQLDYALHEPGESGAFKSVLKQSSPAEAARKFFAGWESGGAEDSTGSARISNAQSAYKAIKGYATGGNLATDQLSVVGEKGWELFKPKSSGHVFDHETSKKILSRGNQKIEVHGSTIQMTVQGNADASTVSKMQSAVNDTNDALVEKIRETLGLNDEGGLIV